MYYSKYVNQKPENVHVQRAQLMGYVENPKPLRLHQAQFWLDDDASGGGYSGVGSGSAICMINGHLYRWQSAL